MTTATVPDYAPSAERLASETYGDSEFNRLEGYRFVPKGEQLLVSRDKQPEKTAGGIIVPQAKNKQPPRGVVKAVGPGRVLDNGKLLMPGTVLPIDPQIYYNYLETGDASNLPKDRTKIGDVVQFGNLAGYEIAIDPTESAEYEIIHIDQVHGDWLPPVE